MVIPTPLENRLGWHYFSDGLHYRDCDLQAWLPEMQSQEVGWLVLKAGTSRAIPERFITGLTSTGIAPLLNFDLPLEDMPPITELRPLLEAYARWGVRHVAFYDRPNERVSWPASTWAQQDLVERFLDRFLPLAGLAISLDLNPLFPLLEPGGSYWDTVFLRDALAILERRRQTVLLDRLILSACAMTRGRSLDWGAGGPERWPASRAYHTPPASQDQRGFRVFDWYLSVARSVLGEERPVFLLETGEPVSANGGQQAQAALLISRLLNGETPADPLHPENLLDPLPQWVIGAALPVFSAASAEGRWYADNGEPRTPARVLREWVLARTQPKTPPTSGRPIQHYLLLPAHEWGISERTLEKIRPFVRKHHPTIGFSIEEALLAERVTVVDEDRVIPDEVLERLRQSGCWVERIHNDGTNFASILAER